MSAETWSACRCRYDASGIDERIDVAVFDAVLVDLLRCRDDDRSYVVMHFSALEDLCCERHVLESAVRARSDDHLLDRHVADLVDRLRILRKVRERNRRLQC